MSGSTPRLPAEWAPQTAVMLTWPHAGTDCAPYLNDVEEVFYQIGAAVLAQEDLLIVAPNTECAAQIRRRLAAIGPGKLRLWCAPSNDIWARDHGPMTVLVDGAPHLMDFIFNGWGGKFVSTLDSAITEQLSTQGAFDGVTRLAINMILEGGAIEVDGNGTLLCRTPCLVDEHRNVGWDKTKVAQALRQHLGIKRIHWLAYGHLEGDDTDAHIDTLARFANPDCIIYQACEDRTDSHYASLTAMAAELAALRNAQGKPYRLIPLPLPAAIHDPETGRRLPAGYANFLIINNAVLLPIYADPADQLAKQRLAEAFPDREIIAIDCRPLIRQYGSLHCITMQLPAELAPYLRDGL